MWGVTDTVSKRAARARALRLSGLRGAARLSGRPPLIRQSRILPVLVASIGEAIQNQEFFQVLESWEPRLGQLSLSPVAPVGG